MLARALIAPFSARKPELTVVPAAPEQARTRYHLLRPSCPSTERLAPIANPAAIVASTIFPRRCSLRARDRFLSTPYQPRRRPRSRCSDHEVHDSSSRCDPTRTPHHWILRLVLSPHQREQVTVVGARHAVKLLRRSTTPSCASESRAPRRSRALWRHARPDERPQSGPRRAVVEITKRPRSLRLPPGSSSTRSSRRLRATRLHSPRSYPRSSDSPRTRLRSRTRPSPHYDSRCTRPPSAYSSTPMRSAPLRAHRAANLRRRRELQRAWSPALTPSCVSEPLPRAARQPCTLAAATP